jgi:hypothetical protein
MLRVLRFVTFNLEVFIIFTTCYNYVIPSPSLTDVTRNYFHIRAISRERFRHARIHQYLGAVCALLIEFSLCVISSATTSFLVVFLRAISIKK